MLPFADYQLLVHNLIDYRSLASTYINVTQALDAILAESICAPFPLPPFANSSMDGYALISDDTINAQQSTPVQLTVTNVISAGTQESISLMSGQAARIFTGAPVPPGADCIIKQEDCRMVDSNLLEISIPVNKGNFIRPQGCDLSQGTEILSPGTRLNPRRIGLLSALGITHVQVYRPFNIILITTGDEIVAPGEPLGKNQFYDSISSMIITACREVNAQVLQHYHCPDDPEKLLDILDNLYTPGDLVLCVGGASVGDRDIAKLALSQHIRFYKVAMQPGMPQGCGIYTSKQGLELPIICFPGNPVSAYVSFEMFIRPAILSAQHSTEGRPKVSAILQNSTTSVPNKLQIRRGFYQYPSKQKEHGSVICMGPAGSHHQRWLAEANCFILFPPAPAECTHIPAGALVQAVLLDGLTEGMPGTADLEVGTLDAAGNGNTGGVAAGGATDEVSVTK